jgi:2-polyprenyl-6-hydroxyphenyl methylase/3-demethylubiquinone-9 3-methyltransferase
MPDKPAVLRQVFRILKPGGAFVCLTPNGDYGWYRWLAPRLGLATRHLSTDQFPSRAELTCWLTAAGFRIARIAHWTFIPRGDVPRGWARVLTLVDGIGKGLGLGVCRGGLAVRAVKPGAKTPASAPAHQSGE